MTAPPTQRPLFTSTHSPIFTLATMAPMEEFSVRSPVMGSAEDTPSTTSTAPPANNEATSASRDLLFITGTTLDDFKSKSTMTRIRKKAMGSYLQKEKKPRNPKRDQQQERRLAREASTSSRASAGSETQDSFIGHDVSPKRNSGNRKHSLTGSPSRDTTQEETTKNSRIPPDSGEFILPTAPIVFPSRENLLLPYITYNPAPFQSIGKPLDPFSTIYQTSHPQVSIGELKMFCSQWFGTRAMGRHWIPTLLKSPHAFLSTLCIASAHLDAVRDQPFESVQTLAIRQEVMHMIRECLVNPASRTNDYNLIALTQLIASEIIACQETALSHHENGLDAMISERGGLESLGVNGRVACTASWVVLQSAILRETRPKPSYSTYANTHSHKTYPPTSTIPESPLYCPKAEYTTVKRSVSITPLALDLLKDIRMMLDLFLHETKQSRHNSLSLKNIFKKITTHYPSIAQLRLRNVLTPNDWKYEAIRISSIITATAIIHRTPLSSAVEKAADLESSTLHAVVTTTTEPALHMSKRHDSPTTCSSFSSSPTYSTAFSPDFQQGGLYTLSHSQIPHGSMSSSLMESPLEISSTGFGMSNSNHVFAFHGPSLPAGNTTTSPSSSSPTTPKYIPSQALLSHLKSSLSRSNLSDCWADMGGVLLWIGLTASAASHCPSPRTNTNTSTFQPTPTTSTLKSTIKTTEEAETETNINKDALFLLRKWLRALSMRVSIVLSFEHPEAVLGSLVRMGEVLEGVEIVEDGDRDGNVVVDLSGNASGGGRASTSTARRGLGKRRRV